MQAKLSCVHKPKQKATWLALFCCLNSVRLTAVH